MNGHESQNSPHRRFNPLRREWVLVSPHRAKRPWLGQVEKRAPEQMPTYDPNCYLCPRNSRAQGVKNPPYANTFVFDNDFPALLPEAPPEAIEENGLFVARTERGICRVVCFSPRHDLTIPRMTPQEIRQVVDVWTEQYGELGSLPWIHHVQIFENRGAMMGASNPHPHCQIWATAELPNEPARELESMLNFRERNGTCLLCRYLEMELDRKARVICQNQGFAAVVPFWAVWPFETLVLSRRHLGCLTDLSNTERDQLGDLLRRLTIRYDNLFEAAFPYTMGFHQRPTDGEGHPQWHFHAHYYPPLLRSATVQKFMVGFEMLGTPQRDLTPEIAAARLKEVSDVHYAEGARKS